MADEEGIAAENLEAARMIAVKAATDMAADELCRGAGRVFERIVIVSNDGEDLAVVAVEAAIRVDDLL
ncbi:MAG TPA: hypothetical protein VFW35_08105 [Sphingomicrobium sp.]|nr:hypothetical protein [Sphingomicrobium sp.]